jgi:pyruvate kinase
MNCARINCAHDTSAVWERMIANVRQATLEAGRTCRVLMDIAGPKPRTGEALTPPDARLTHGDRLLLTRGRPVEIEYAAFQARCTLPEILDQVQVGESVWIDDGCLGTQVEAQLPEGLLLRVTQVRPKGEKLRSGKGLNFPDTRLHLSPLTDQDQCDLDFIAAHADIVGYSFVQDAADLDLLQRELSARMGDRQPPAIVAKIETRRAVQNLPELIVQAAGRQPFGVMIARGDLAVEIGYQRLAEIQEEILWICEAAHVPVIWATQVLETFVRKGLPSRAEMTDAAMAERAECVMLNKGPYVAEAVTILDDVLRRMQAHQVKKTPQLRALGVWIQSLSR